MNKRLFKKCEIILNLCNSGDELLNLLIKFKDMSFDKNDKIVILMDYSLDNEFGD